MSVYKEYLNDMQSSLTGEEILEIAKRGRIKKPIKKVYAALAITAAVFITGTVTVGAACNWDFKSLLLSDYSRNRHETADYNSSNIGNETEHFMYGDTVTIPEGMQEFHEMTAKELEMLDKISVDVNKVFEADDYNFAINGIIYDGYVLRISYTVINNSGVYDTYTDDAEFFMELDIEGDESELAYRGLGAGNVNAVPGDRMTWHSEYEVKFPENADKFTVVINKRGETVNGYTPYPEFGRVTIDIPDASELSQEYKLDNFTRLGNYGESHLKKIRFSPLGVFVAFDFNLSGKLKDINDIYVGYPPVYITMKDGTVIGFQDVWGNGGGRGHGEVNEDGSFSYDWQITQENYLIDAFNVAAVQIGNEYIELDDSMIIED